MAKGKQEGRQTLARGPLTDRHQQVVRGGEFLGDGFIEPQAKGRVSAHTFPQTGDRDTRQPRLGSSLGVGGMIADGAKADQVSREGEINDLLTAARKDTINADVT